jgi:hypothetical protein
MRRPVVLVLLAIAVLLAAGLMTFESAEAPPAKPATTTAEPSASSPRASAMDELVEVAPTAMREAVAQSATNPRTGSLRVRVRRAMDGRPLAGLAGAIRSESEDGVLLREAATGDDGEFVLSELPPGAVEVRLDELDRRRVRIEAGRESVIEFTVERALAIDGLVVDESDAPVAGADVFAIRHVDWPVPDRFTRIAVSDEQGRFNASCVGGPWALRAQHGALRSALVRPGTGDGEFLGDGAARVRLVVAPAQLVVRGTVFRDDGRTAAGGSITLLGARVRARGGVAPDERCVERTSIGADGNFELRTRRGGVTAELIVAVPACGTVILPLALPSVGPLCVDPIVREAAIIAGIVRDETGRAIGGASLRVRGVQRMDEFAAAVTRDDGSFHLQGVPRGVRLVVIASAPLHESDTESVAPIDGANVDLDFTLVRQALIAGRLLRADGSPLAGWRVELRRNGQPEPRNPATVADDGRFALGTEAGSPAQLFAFPRESSLRIPLADGRLLTPGAGPEQVLVIRDDELPSAHVCGRVVVGEGSDAARSALSLFDGRTRARNLRRVGQDGRFEFGPVPARRYRLLLMNHDGIEQELAEFAVAHGQRLELGDLRAR